MKSNYQESREKKIARYRELSAKNGALSLSLYNRSKQILSIIPPGQPILVGHHSGRRHCNDLNRVDNLMRANIAAGEKSAYYAERANTMENNNTISSDNPDALDLLRAKLTNLQRLQEFMKATNKCIKKKDRDGFLKLEGATVEQWEELTKPGRFQGMGFPSYRLTNNNAVINTTKKRIEQLGKLESKEDVTHTFGAIEVHESYTDNRVQISFPGKPSREAIDELKRHGFRWAPSVGMWQRFINNTAIYYAKQIAGKYESQF